MLIITMMGNVTSVWGTAFALKSVAALNLQANIISVSDPAVLFPCVTVCHECKYESSAP